MRFQIGATGLVVRVVLVQTGCAALAALLFFAYRGSSSGIAALAGGLIVAVGSAVFGLGARSAPGIAGAARLSRAMLAGVALKWLWFVLALYLALARLKLEAVPLLVGTGNRAVWLLGRDGSAQVTSA